MGLPADIPLKLLVSTRTVCPARVSIGSVTQVVLSEVAEGFVGAGAHKSGRELFGDRSSADFEIMSLMISSLHSLGLDDIHVELGDVSVYRTLIEQAALDASVSGEIFGLIQKKARHALVQLTKARVADPALAGRINALPELCGSASVLDDANVCLPVTAWR